MSATLVEFGGLAHLGCCCCPKVVTDCCDNMLPTCLAATVNGREHFITFGEDLSGQGEWAGWILNEDSDIFYLRLGCDGYYWTISITRPANHAGEEVSVFADCLPVSVTLPEINIPSVVSNPEFTVTISANQMQDCGCCCCLGGHNSYTLGIPEIGAGGCLCEPQWTTPRELVGIGATLPNGSLTGTCLWTNFQGSQMYRDVYCDPLLPFALDDPENYPANVCNLGSGQQTYLADFYMRFAPHSKDNCKAIVELFLSGDPCLLGFPGFSGFPIASWEGIAPKHCEDALLDPYEYIELDLAWHDGACDYPETMFLEPA